MCRFNNYEINVLLLKSITNNFHRQSSVLDVLTLKAGEKEKLETIIKHRLTPQPVKIRAGIQ